MKDVKRLCEEFDVTAGMRKGHFVEARTQSEKDFFAEYIATVEDESNPNFIKKGAINEVNIVNEIVELNPDLLVCYGSSLIKSELLIKFENKFLNVHLGLSP